MDVRLLVGLNFKRLRVARGLTQEEAAALTGVSQQYISGLEQGRRNPTVLTLHELTGPLNARPIDMFTPVQHTN